MVAKHLEMERHGQYLRVYEKIGKAIRRKHE